MNASLVKENTASGQPPATVKPIIFRRAVPATFPISSATNGTSTPPVSSSMHSKTASTTSYTVIATGSSQASSVAQQNNTTMPLYSLSSSEHQPQQPQQQTPQSAGQYQHAGATFEYGAPLYAQASPYYHPPGNATSTGNNGSATGPGGQVLYSSGAYILQTTTNVDGDSHTLAHTTRASPATVQWLLENYETADGVSLPRSTIYAHYMRHCEEEKLEPMNPASFGKLIRSVFLGLRTRRLGTRGNSKYHYYGIRIKASSPLVNISEEMIMASAGRQYSSPPQQKKFGGGGRNGQLSRYDQQGGQTGQSGTTTITVIGTPAPIPPSVAHQVGPVGTQQQQQAPQVEVPQQAQQTSTVSPQQQYLGDVNLAMPIFEPIDLTGVQLPGDITEQDVRSFEQFYREHCESLVDLVVNLQFNLIEQIWSSFWRGIDTSRQSSPAKRSKNGDYEEDDDEEVDEEVDDDEEEDEEGGSSRRINSNVKSRPNGDASENRMPRLKLVQLVSHPVIQYYMRRIDSSLYQSLVYTLLPDMLRPIPSSLTQAIRNFAKGMEGWLKNSMIGLPEEAVKAKLGPAVAFAQTLRRYTSLNHLAQAARAVLQNQEHLQQMVADLNRVDFVNVQEQAAWVTSCENKVVKQIEIDLKRLLSIENSLDNWAAWLESVVDLALQPATKQLSQVENQAQHLAEASRQFLLKWSFYNSMVIRDLTLRSAHSFGSFHLIRLLFDEYIYFVLEHRVAHSVREVPIAVLDASRGCTDVPLVEPLYTMDIMQARPDLRGPRLYPVVNQTLQAAATVQQLAASAIGTPTVQLAQPKPMSITTSRPGNNPTSSSAKPSIITLTAASSPGAAIKV